MKMQVLFKMTLFLTLHGLGLVPAINAKADDGLAAGNAVKQVAKSDGASFEVVLESGSERLSVDVSALRDKVKNELTIAVKNDLNRDLKVARFDSSCGWVIGMTEVSKVVRPGDVIELRLSVRPEAIVGHFQQSVRLCLSDSNVGRCDVSL